MTTTPSALNTALADEFPDVLSGHYSTPDGREMLARYTGLTREQLSGADRTDTEIAFMCGMASGADIESTTTLHLAKDRIRWLSAQLALQQKDNSAALEIDRLKGEIGRLREALEQIQATGTRHETVRTGDMYADDGYSDYEIVSDEAQIARAALQREAGKL